MLCVGITGLQTHQNCEYLMVPHSGGGIYVHNGKQRQNILAMKLMESVAFTTLPRQQCSLFH
jgi:hypothetical protein